MLSPAVIPIGLTVSWRKLTGASVLAGAIIGAVLGMTAWMIGCLKIYGNVVSTAGSNSDAHAGEITITTLADPLSAVCSGLTGLLLSGIITVGVSLLST